MHSCSGAGLKKLFSELFEFFGEQHWWPAKTKFEVCVGAILTQNTSWKNVEKSIMELKKKRKLTVSAMNSTSLRDLTKLIRSSGYYNQKAKTLKDFCKHVVCNYHGNLNSFLSKPNDGLREELLSIKGIGPETADSIILYAAKKPSFVVDAYTERVMNRFFGLKMKSKVALKEFLEKNLNKDVALYNEFHALLVALGKEFCRKKPLCCDCPINKKCSHYGFNKKTAVKI
ncbi:MAG: endonuclease III domain-containing protein [Candidatus Diapherotrites archaeon]|nr:endonuclease III domain-containing protein [Candidatus Diapherotrites archaeon]